MKPKPEIKQDKLVLYSNFDPSTFELFANVFTISIAVGCFVFAYRSNAPLLLGISSLAVIYSVFSAYRSVEKRFFRKEMIGALSKSGVTNAEQKFYSWDAIKSSKYVQGELWLIGEAQAPPVLKLERGTLGDDQFKLALEFFQSCLPSELSWRHSEN